MSHRNVQELMKKHAISIKKKYGQNFLLDKNILMKIVNTASIDEETLVIEIGPGLGSLTEYLVAQAKHVLAYEIDTQLIPVLQESFQNQRVTLIHDDILKRNIDDDINELNETFSKVIVVANLPYYITTAILMKCLEESQRIDTMIVMMQYEVARRITASRQTKDYNALSVAIQYRAKTTLAFKVPRSVFLPPPNVDSAVVVLDYYQTPPVPIANEAYFFQFIKACFRQRRKTILNNLSLALEMDKEHLREHLIECKIQPEQRAETLSLEDFSRLANYFFQLNEVNR